MKKEQIVISVVVLLSVMLISYAGYEYFWKNLKLSELVSRSREYSATSTRSQKEVAGDKVASTTDSSKDDTSIVTIEAKPALTANNLAPAILSITYGGKTSRIGLMIKSDCQTASTTSQGPGRIARLNGLSLDGKSVPLNEKILTCVYPTETSEAYVPDPRLNVTKINESAGQVYFSLTGVVNQGYGQEVDWRQNFVFDVNKQTIK